MPQKLASRRHPDSGAIDPASAQPGSARSSPARARPARCVTVNLAESPLAWLHSRGLLTRRQALAGEQLRADFTRAGLEPSVTMRWDAAPPDGSSRGFGGHDHASVARIDARRRFHAALDHAGTGLADVCWRVICAGEAMPGAERALGWPSRSGRIILALALDRLADHYRLPEA